MNNNRYNLTFYGGLWLAGFIILFLTPGWPLWSWFLAGMLFVLCPTWQHVFEFIEEKALYRAHMKKHVAEHEQNLENDRNNGRG